MTASLSTANGSNQPTEQRGLLFRHPWIFFAIFGVVVLTTMRVACGSGRKLGDLTVIGTVPEFSLRDQHGQPFGTKDLTGKPWIASFFFTSCRAECPAIIDAMRHARAALDRAGARPGEVPMVAFSVDPEFDTSEVLARYAADNALQSADWHLLTGERAALEAIIIGKNEVPSPGGPVVQAGFATGWGPRKSDAGIVSIAHSMKLVLVDPRGGIRHPYFSALDKTDIDNIAIHALALARGEVQ